MRKIPMRVSFNCLGDNKIDYKSIAIASIYGNWNNNGKSKGALYVPHTVLKEHKEEIEKLSHHTLATLFASLNRASKRNENFIQNIRLRSNKRIMNISCKNKKGKEYVLVEEDILRILIDKGNSNIIKTYLFLKSFCYNEPKLITREYMCKILGITPCNSNLLRVSKITNTLEELGLIIKESEKDGVCINTMYFLRTYEDWKSINKGE